MSTVEAGTLKEGQQICIEDRPATVTNIDHGDPNICLFVIDVWPYRLWLGRAERVTVAAMDADPRATPAIGQFWKHVTDDRPDRFVIVSVDSTGVRFVSAPDQYGRRTDEQHTQVFSRGPDDLADLDPCRLPGGTVLTASDEVIEEAIAFAESAPIRGGVPEALTPEKS